MTTIAIPRALLEQALESMCWAARTLDIDPDEAQNYHRSLENIRAALSAPATAPEQCWCDEQNIGEPGVSCGDCPTRDYKAPATAPDEIERLRKDAERNPMHEGEIQAAWLGQGIEEPMPYTFELGIRSAERFNGIKGTP